MAMQAKTKPQKPKPKTKTPPPQTTPGPGAAKRGALAGMSYAEGKAATKPAAADPVMAGAGRGKSDNPHGVTGDASGKDWSLLRQEVAEFEQADATELTEKTSDQAALDRGKTLSASKMRPDGMIEEMTVGTVDVPFADFCRKVLPEKWGKNLAGYIGGEVQVGARDEQGRATRQQERMILETPLSQYLGFLGDAFPMLRPLDMTKTEEIEYGSNYAKVRWRVYQTDNETVKQDIGYVNFEADGNKTKITFHSAHKYTSKYTSPFNWGPLTQFRDWMTARNLREYFVSAIDHYRDLAEG